MASDSFKVKKSLNIEPKSGTSGLDSAGDIGVDSADSNLIKYNDGSVVKTVADTSSTQTLTNKTLTSPVINTSISGTAIVDEDNMVSDSATKVPTQQSVKAYVDTHIADTTTHGTTGDIVGTSDSQTLSNKTLATPTITGTLEADAVTDVDLGTSNSNTTVDIGTGSGTNTINIGGANSTVNLIGSVSNQNVTNLNVTDKLITINDGGAAASGGGAGFEVEENGSATGYVKVSSDRNSIEIKAPNTNGVLSLTPGASNDTAAMLAATQTLTNKTLTSAVVNEGADFIEDDSISSPSAGRRRLQLKTDGKLYLRDSGGNETEIGSGGGAGINYIENPSAETNTTGWATYADAAATSPVDGTGGSAGITFVRETTDALRGLASFYLGFNSNQGNGISYDFTIDPADKGKVLQGSFDYDIYAGYADDDLSVWIYDVTNSRLIQPAPYLLKKHSLPSEKFSFEFQTSVDSVSYRLIIHVASTTSGSVIFDNFVVGPQAKLYGSPVTDWVSFTPTGSWSTNTTYTGFWRRVGDSMEVQAKIATSGAPTSANLTVNLPPGYSIDTAKVVNASGAAEQLGLGAASDSGTTYKLHVVYSSATAVLVGYQNNASGTQTTVTQAAPFTFGASDFVTINFKVPISGWSSSAIMSSDANVRPTGARIFLSADQTGVNPNASAVKINLDSTASTGLGFDTHTAWSSNRYNVPVPGKYAIRGVLSFLGTNSLANNYQAAIYKNGSVAAYGDALHVKTAGDYFTRTVSTTLDLVAGDYIEFYIFGSGNNSASTLTADGIAGGNATYADIMLQSGPSQIAASDSITAIFTTPTATSLSSATQYYIDYATKVVDSHGAVTGTGSGAVSTTNTGQKFTAPISGIYQVTANAALNGATGFNGTSERVNLSVYVDGVETRILSRLVPATGDTIAHVGGSCDLRLLAGQRVEIGYNQDSGGALSLLSTALTGLSIKRVGNY